MRSADRDWMGVQTCLMPYLGGSEQTLIAFAETVMSIRTSPSCARTRRVLRYIPTIQLITLKLGSVHRVASM